MTAKSIVSTGVNIAATTTAVTVQLPFDSSGGRPRYIRVTATGSAYVKLGGSNVVAVPGDLLVQPADGVMLVASGCTYISAITVSGSCAVSVAPTDDGRWDSSSPSASDVFRYYGKNANVYLPGVGVLNGLTAGNYIDSAGTTPGAVDQPVGLALSAAGALGPELVVNGTNLVTTAGWVSRANATLSTVNGSLRMTLPAAGASRAYTSIATTAGRSYRVLLNLLAVNATLPTCHAMAYSNVGNGLLGDTGISSSPKSDVTVTFTATGAVTYFEVGNDGGGAANEFMEWGNISIREVTGIHASQATAANRPILRRGALNLQPFSNDVLAAGWSVVNITKSAGALTRAGTGAAYSGSPAIAAPMSVGSKFTAAALVKAKSLGGRFALRPTGTYPDRVDAVFDMVAGTVVGVVNGGAFPVGTASISGPDANGFYLCAATGTVGGTSLVNLILGPTDSSLTIGGWEGGSTVLSDCFISGAAIFAGTLTASQIQALGGIPTTTTAPASTALGPYTWDTTGGKSLTATFPAGNESVTVIDARPTGQVTATAQNVVGAYSINTNTNGRIIVNGALTAPDLLLLQNLANKLAGL